MVFLYPENLHLASYTLSDLEGNPEGTQWNTYRRSPVIAPKTCPEGTLGVLHLIEGKILHSGRKRRARFPAPSHRLIASGHRVSRAHALIRVLQVTKSSIAIDPIIVSNYYR